MEDVFYFKIHMCLCLHFQSYQTTISRVTRREELFCSRDQSPPLFGGENYVKSKTNSPCVQILDLRHCFGRKFHQIEGKFSVSSNSRSPPSFGGENFVKSSYTFKFQTSYLLGKHFVAKISVFRGPQIASVMGDFVENRQVRNLVE